LRNCSGGIVDGFRLGHNGDMGLTRFSPAAVVVVVVMMERPKSLISWDSEADSDVAPA
jgi:hypothetical protein